jgi:hypothetical protein
LAKTIKHHSLNVRVGETTPQNAWNHFLVTQEITKILGLFQEVLGGEKTRFQLGLGELVSISQIISNNDCSEMLERP